MSSIIIKDIKYHILRSLTFCNIRITASNIRIFQSMSYIGGMHPPRFKVGGGMVCTIMTLAEVFGAGNCMRDPPPQVLVTKITTSFSAGNRD